MPLSYNVREDKRDNSSVGWRISYYDFQKFIMLVHVINIQSGTQFDIQR